MHKDTFLRFSHSIMSCLSFSVEQINNFQCFTLRQRKWFIWHNRLRYCFIVRFSKFCLMIFFSLLLCQIKHIMCAVAITAADVCISDAATKAAVNSHFYLQPVNKKTTTYISGDSKSEVRTFLTCGAQRVLKLQMCCSVLFINLIWERKIWTKICFFYLKYVFFYPILVPFAPVGWCFSGKNTLVVLESLKKMNVPTCCII